MKLFYNFDDFDEFEYDVVDTRPAIIDALQEELGCCTKTAIEIVNSFNKLDVYDKLEERYEEDIKQYFKDDAKDLYEENKARSRDELGYFGMKQSDFI